jgi:SAM-dependent methyltransferase
VPIAATDPELVADIWTEATLVADGQPTAQDVAEVIERRRVPLVKGDLGGGIAHPARFSGHLLAIFAQLLAGCRTVLDPFAGTGRIHELADRYDTRGIEIEPEWAAMHERTQVGNALELPYPDATFDAICTSPTYGNRLADHHDASDPEKRRTYTHDLGRKLDPESSGALQWGDDYRAFHERAWDEAVRVLRPGGRFVLNMKDHIRAGERQPVTGWHLGALGRRGLFVVDVVAVPLRGMRVGENDELRLDHEFVVALERT